MSDYFEPREFPQINPAILLFEEFNDTMDAAANALIEPIEPEKISRNDREWLGRDFDDQYSNARKLLKRNRAMAAFYRSAGTLSFDVIFEDQPQFAELEAYAFVEGADPEKAKDQLITIVERAAGKISVFEELYGEIVPIKKPKVTRRPKQEPLVTDVLPQPPPAKSKFVSFERLAEATYAPDAQESFVTVPHSEEITQEDYLKGIQGMLDERETDQISTTYILRFMEQTYDITRQEARKIFGEIVKGGKLFKVDSEGGNAVWSFIRPDTKPKPRKQAAREQSEDDSIDEDNTIDEIEKALTVKILDLFTKPERKMNQGETMNGLAAKVNSELPDIAFHRLVRKLAARHLLRVDNKGALGKIRKGSLVGLYGQDLKLHWLKDRQTIINNLDEPLKK